MIYTENTKAERIAVEYLKDNKSFVDMDSFFELMFPIKYSKPRVREIYENAIKTGIDIGLREASLEGQKLDLYHNAGPEHKQFLDALYKFLEQHNKAIQWHPVHGMTVVDLVKNQVK